jgi:hypothetical protein
LWDNVVWWSRVGNVKLLLSDAFAVVWWSRVGNVKLLLSNAFAVAFRIWWFTEEAVVITNKTFQELADVLIKQSVAVVDGSRHKAGGVKQLFFEHVNAKLVLEVKATFGGIWNSHRVGRRNGRQQEEWVSADFRQWSGGSSQDKQNVKLLQNTTRPVRTSGSFSMKTIR